MAHNAKAWYGQGGREASWYVEASAEWAGWYYAQDPDAYERFTRDFQLDNLSLLVATNENSHMYGSWIWPLFMQQEKGASSVFQSWADAETATAPAGIDNAVDSQLSFEGNFRDFSVWNLSLADYDRKAGDTGLEDDIWQSKIESFPADTHLITDFQTIGLGGLQVPAEIDVLAAQDNGFEITDPAVRQVRIDLSKLQNASTADLDVIGRLAGNGKPPYEWRRLREVSSTVTLCRDLSDENFDRLYVVLSNHSSSRDAAKGGPDSKAAVKDSYSIKAQDHCDIPIAYEGTFKMKERNPNGPTLVDFDATGHVKYVYGFTAAGCDSPFSPPTPDSLQYCYFLDSAQESWTLPNVSDDRCNYFPQPAQFSYANDQGQHGGIQIIPRSPDPSFSNLYHVSLGSSTKTMDIDTTDVDPEQPCNRGTFTIRLPFYSLTSEYPPATAPRFTGWPLKGFVTVEVGQTIITTVTWSWDLSPIFAP
jgi:hypothetical protein